MPNGLDRVQGLQKELEKIIGNNIIVAQKTADELCDALDSLSRHPERIVFEVRLDSHWADHGEKSTTAKSSKDLRSAIKRAQKRFMAVNNRNDLQATYTVLIRVDKIRLTVPRSFYEKLI